VLQFAGAKETLSSRLNDAWKLTRDYISKIKLNQNGNGDGNGNGNGKRAMKTRKQKRATNLILLTCDCISILAFTTFSCRVCCFRADLCRFWASRVCSES